MHIGYIYIYIYIHSLWHIHISYYTSYLSTPKMSDWWHGSTSLDRQYLLDRSLEPWQPRIRHRKDGWDRPGPRVRLRSSWAKHVVVFNQNVCYTGYTSHFWIDQATKTPWKITLKNTFRNIAPASMCPVFLSGRCLSASTPWANWLRWNLDRAAEVLAELTARLQTIKTKTTTSKQNLLLLFLILQFALSISIPKQ